MDKNCVIKIPAEKSFVYDAVDITVSGLQKNQKVTIRAVSKDYYCINAGMSEQGQNSEWESYGVFLADDRGCIELKNAEPLQGSYKTCDAMGLFYSMKIKKLRKKNAPNRISDVDENRSFHIFFTVEFEGRVLASKTHVRRFCDDTVRSETIAEKTLTARYFTGSITRKRPAVIVVSGSEGRIEKAQAIAQVLAQRGYSALAVCYFGMDGTSPHLNMIPLEIIEAAIGWLKNQGTVDEEHIGIYGRSKGGELVLTAASFFNEITCVIANTPSCYVYEGLRKGMPSRRSSWSYRNVELPFIKLSYFVMIRMIIRKILGEKNLVNWMYNQMISKSGTHKTSIDVEKINGPILFISSASDAVWPSLLHCRRALKRLHEKKFKYLCKHYTYEKSGHMLTLPFQSISSLKKCNGYLKEWEEACIDSWNQTIDFLDKWSK